jgi:hypothetical protein
LGKGGRGGANPLLVLDAAEGIAGVEREGAGTKRVEVDSAGIESQIEVVGLTGHIGQNYQFLVFVQGSSKILQDL